MDIIVTDPYLTDEQVAQAGGRKVDLDELLATADVISLHIPLTPATRHTINAGAIATDATGSPADQHRPRRAHRRTGPDRRPALRAARRRRAWTSSTPRTPT